MTRFLFNILRVLVCLQAYLKISELDFAGELRCFSLYRIIT